MFSLRVIGVQTFLNTCTWDKRKIIITFVTPESPKNEIGLLSSNKNISSNINRLHQPRTISMRGCSSSPPEQSEGAHFLHYPVFQLSCMPWIWPFATWILSQTRGNNNKLIFPLSWMYSRGIKFAPLIFVISYEYTQNYNCWTFRIPWSCSEALNLL